MRRLRYLAAARRDIADIYAYIQDRSGSSVTAERFIRRLRAQCLHIAGLSATLGRARPELQPGVRSFPFEGYLVVMRYTGDVLEIVNVIEGHRDIKALFRKSES